MRNEMVFKISKAKKWYSFHEEKLKNKNIENISNCN